jgi:hypothetical protein
MRCNIGPSSGHIIAYCYRRYGFTSTNLWLNLIQVDTIPQLKALLLEEKLESGCGEVYSLLQQLWSSL